MRGPAESDGDDCGTSRVARILPRMLPPPEEHVLDASAVSLAARIRAGRLGADALLEAHIDRIAAVNGTINALVADRFEAARREARAVTHRVADARRAGPEAVAALPPLLGVPFSVKEFVGVEGLPQTAGLVRRREVLATRDATVVARLRAAGGIVLGVTNVAEGGLWMESFNPVFGLTRNPWDVRRSAGGSSGGEAALIAAGGAPFGVGADIGGSIRIPAAFCGLFGHKPTGGLVPNTGHWPGETDMGPVLTIGPMCRRAEDLMPLLRLMAGPDGEDPTCRAQPLGEPAAVELRRLRVFAVDEVGAARFSPAVRGAIRRAGEALRHAGARVETLKLPDLKWAYALWTARLMSMGEMAYAEILGNGTPISLREELLSWVLRRRRHTAPAVMIAALEHVGRRLPLPTSALIERLDGLRTDLEHRLGPDAVLLHPPYSRPAPRHFTPLATPLDFACCGIFNALEMPATAVPAGFDAHGMPLSVQVVGRRGDDHLTIAVAMALERFLGGFTRAEPRPVRPERTGL